MKKSRYSGGKIISISKQAGTSIDEPCREHGISNKWRTIFGGMDAPMLLNCPY